MKSLWWKHHLFKMILGLPVLFFETMPGNSSNIDHVKSGALVPQFQLDMQHDLWGTPEKPVPKWRSWEGYEFGRWGNPCAVTRLGEDLLLGDDISYQAHQQDGHITFILSIPRFASWEPGGLHIDPTYLKIGFRCAYRGWDFVSSLDDHVCKKRVATHHHEPPKTMKKSSCLAT